MRKIILALSLLFSLFPLSQAKTYKTPEIHILVYNRSKLLDKDIQDILKVATTFFDSSGVQIVFDTPRAELTVENPTCLFFMDNPMPGTSESQGGITFGTRAYVFPNRIIEYSHGVTWEVGYVAAHEIGHALGLSHTDDSVSLMYKYADMKRISRLYPIRRFSHEEITIIVNTYRRQHALARES